MRLKQLERLAMRLAGQAASDRNDIVGVLLIGSVALARPSADSDIDLAILLQGSDAEPRYECVDGVWVGYEFFDIEALRSLGDAPMLSQEHLRNAARLATGKILAQKDGALASMLARLRTARPRVEETRRLFTIVDNSRLVAAAGAGRQQLRALQGMAFALSILALNLTLNRFQKPKWVLQDLTETEHCALIEVIDLLFAPSEHAEMSARSVCDDARRAISTLFKFEGLPEPRYISSDHDLEYVYRTLLDAESLLAAKRWKDASFVAAWALRLGQRLAENRSRQRGEPFEFTAVAEVNTLEIAPAAAALSLQMMVSEARRLALAYSAIHELNP